MILYGKKSKERGRNMNSVYTGKLQIYKNAV